MTGLLWLVLLAVFVGIGGGAGLGLWLICWGLWSLEQNLRRRHR